MIGLIFVAIAGLVAGWIIRDLIHRDTKARGEILDMTSLSRDRGTTRVTRTTRRPW